MFLPSHLFLPLLQHPLILGLKWFSVVVCDGEVVQQNIGHALLVHPPEALICLDLRTHSLKKRSVILQETNTVLVRQRTDVNMVLSIEFSGGGGLSFLYKTSICRDS